MNGVARILMVVAGALLAGMGRAQQPEPLDGPGDQESETAQIQAGLTVADLEFEKETLTVAIWYPTREVPERFEYGDTSKAWSRVALDAAVAKERAPFPVVVFAHGLYGSGYNVAWFAEHLARHGYVVAAPDFRDTAADGGGEPVAFSRIRGQGSGSPIRVLASAKKFVSAMEKDRQKLLTWLETRRLRQTSFVLDELLRMNRAQGHRFHGAIREDAAGLCGHSLGGLTALGKVGAHPVAEFTDARFKAALLFSAPSWPYEESAANVRIPVMLMAGDDDAAALHPEQPRRTLYDRLGPPRYYLVLSEANHLSFGNGVCKDTPLSSAHSVPQARALCAAGLAFFDRHLLSRETPGDPLGSKDAAWAYFCKEEKTGKPVEWGTEPAPGDGAPGGLRPGGRKRGEGGDREDRRRR
ncbi:MAG: dienelactone hydrolase family protein [Planctomycetes bacterium]|nr:dienelactone hydrolase family protein [Planctomycetota bacterium]